LTGIFGSSLKHYQEDSMDDKGKAMVLASFAADSLALGAHWIYDTESIVKLFGRVESFLKPSPKSYHVTKDKGDFTHYGDQAYVLLESLAAKKGFDLFDFSARWRALFEDYNGYVDHATKLTLSAYASGGTYEDPGSPSDDLAGASRMAPLVYAHRSDIEILVKNVKAQTRMTHSSSVTIDSAEFFARVTWRVLQGTQPVEAIAKISREHFGSSPISGWVQAGLESKDKDSVSAISRFGQSCHTGEAFPGVVQLIARYENDLKEGLIQSVMAGGDNAARGMMVGMVLGAHLGMESLPAEWCDALKKKDRILTLLEKL
jgi:ADP-ribosylglycohydrolase